MKTLDELVLQIKSEIISDVMSGFIPVTAKNLGDIDNYRDVNCYGGLCEDDISEELISNFGGRDADDGMPDGMLKYINSAHAKIDNWITAGEMYSACTTNESEKLTHEKLMCLYADLLKKNKKLFNLCEDIISDNGIDDHYKKELQKFK